MTDIPANVLLDDLHPARFLQVTDLTERWKLAEITVTISRLAYEDTIPNPKDLDPETADAKNPRGKPRVVIEPVLYFLTKHNTEWPHGMLLAARENTRNLKAATGAHCVGDLIGKRVTIVIGQHKGKAVLRISPTAPIE
jgi:hypothetical protein